MAQRDNTRDIAIQNQQNLASLKESTNKGFNDVLLDVRELKDLLENIQRNTSFASGELGRKVDKVDFEKFLNSDIDWKNALTIKMKVAMGVIAVLGAIGAFVFGAIDWILGVYDKIRS